MSEYIIIKGYDKCHKKLVSYIIMKSLDRIRETHIISIVSELLTRATAPDSADSYMRSKIMKSNKSNLSNLSKDIVSAVSLFAEFGQRNHYEHKGRVIVQNDVTDPVAEGLFLARCARKIARKQGVTYAYEWAMKAFVDNVYNRLQVRNKEHETERQRTLSDMRLFGAKALVATRA